MAQISLRVDDDIKRKAEETLDTIGLSMSTAINIFLKTVVRENRIPFELSADPFYSASNIRYLESIMRDVKDGKAHFEEHELIEVE
jgi:DNA-damage-inducible protein J